MQGFRRCTFIPLVAGLSGDIVCKPYEATDSSGSNPAEIDTALAGTFANGTDENLPGIIEVRDSDLTADYNFVTLQVTPAAGDPFACVAILSEPYEAPVTNTVNTHVAFNWVRVSVRKITGRKVARLKKRVSPPPLPYRG
jgi:hypothetical protein